MVILGLQVVVLNGYLLYFNLSASSSGQGGLIGCLWVPMVEED